MGLWQRLFGSSANAPPGRVTAMGQWTIDIPAGFKTIDNGDSWQAYKDDRVIYVSSIVVQKARGGRTPVDELHAMGVKQLDRSTSGERSRFAKGNVTGEAQVARADSGWRLTGFMVTDGVLATCVLDFPTEADKGWALATWQSLEHP